MLQMISLPLISPILKTPVMRNRQLNFESECDTPTVQWRDELWGGPRKKKDRLYVAVAGNSL